MNDEQQRELNYGRLDVTLDRAQVFPDDPGQGTPAIVEIKRERVAATLWCASDVGEVDGIQLSQDELNWLDNVVDEANEFLYEN